MELTNLNTDRKKGRKPSVDLGTMIYGKVPPQATELEGAVLGAILIESSCLPQVVSLIFTEVFYIDSYQRIFKAILNLYDNQRPVDLLSVVEQLKVNEDLDNVGGQYAVTKLTRDVVSTANIEAHCILILQKYLGRELITISSEAMNDAYDDSVDVFDLYDRTDNAILNVQERVLSGSIKDMQCYAGKVYEQYETIKVTGVLGIQTGILPLDKMFCGLVPPDLIIIAARPAQGKTALALSITHYTSVLNNIPCAWFSLEMNGSQLTMRLSAIDSGLSHKDIRQGKIAPCDEQRFYTALDRVGKAPIFIEDRGVINIRTIRTRAHILKRKNKIGYIVVDYLQLMQGIDVKNKNREAVISEISRGLKELARELNIPIIALSQLSREVEKRPDKMPQLSDLRESGAIEQDADEVIFLMRPESYDFTEPVEIKGKEYDVRGLCIGKGAKNRHGDCENFAMTFIGYSMHFKTHYRDINTAQEINQTTREVRDYTQSNSGLSDEEKQAFG